MNDYIIFLKKEFRIVPGSFWISLFANMLFLPVLFSIVLINIPINYQMYSFNLYFYPFMFSLLGSFSVYIMFSSEYKFRTGEIILSSGIKFSNFILYKVIAGILISVLSGYIPMFLFILLNMARYGLPTGIIYLSPVISSLFFCAANIAFSVVLKIKGIIKKILFIIFILISPVAITMLYTISSSLNIGFTFESVLYYPAMAVHVFLFIIIATKNIRMDSFIE